MTRMETVQLQRSAESTDVTLSIANSSSILLCKEHVSRSPVLLTLLADGDETSFAAPQGYLQAWLQLVQHNTVHLLERKGVPRLLVFLKAADFLADEAAVTATCQELGHRLFRTEQQPMESSLATQSLTESSAASTVPETGFSSFSTSSGDTVEGPVDSILDHVPSHLGISIVQASDACIFDCLSMLPEAYHALALCAHFPGITQKNFCHLEAKMSTLIHGPPSSADLQALFKAVSSFESLQELHMGIVGLLPDAYGPLADAFEKALTDCDQLQSVAISADHRSQGFLTAQIARVLAQRLPNLANLKRLNLHACGEFMAEWTDEQRHPGSVRSASYRDLFQALCRCTVLEELNLTMMLMHEGISSDRDHFIASNLANFPSTLRVLKLRGSVSGASLRALDARISELFTGSLNFHWLPKLQELDIGHSFLGDYGTNALLPILTRLGKLQALDLSENEITSVGAERLAPVLGNLTNLTRIDVRDNKLEDSGILALCATFQNLKGLQHVDVSYCDVSIEGSTILGNALGGVTNLRHLHMKGCKLTKRLWEREGDPDSDCMGARALADALRQHTNLRSLSLVNTLLKSDAMAIMAPSLAFHILLTSLDLHFNIGFGSIGVESLSRTLENLRNLQSLRISCFDVTRAAATQFAGVLGTLTDLRKLGLLGFHTDIWSLARAPGRPNRGRPIPRVNAHAFPHDAQRAALTLASRIMSRQQQGEQNLYHDDEPAPMQLVERSDYSGVVSLVSALRNLTNLEELQVMSCGLTAECAPHIAASIKCMANLKTLQMDNNPLGDGGAAALTSTLRQLTRLRWLTMASTELTINGAALLVESVKKHKYMERCAISVMDSDVYNSSHREVLRKPWVSIY